MTDNDKENKEVHSNLFSLIEGNVSPNFFKEREDDLKIEELEGKDKKEFLRIMKDEVERLSLILKNL